ncbi:SCE4755 family polysaccharide monooxygenase-like protein [Sorangium sp. So ce131]|uniref:SCE4755 family polysaccharide monooxygenase-like protein n=1 Tax=Sorangium sp. So ce131 TaxID=3133282 RepID=UPI003F62F567
MTPWRVPAAMLAAAAAGALHPAVAHAHFSLLEPACYSEQNNLGDPQKSAPCGQADPGNPAQPTGEVTTFVQGQTITLTIDETIFHPGHYRVSIAPNPDALPPDPVVTPGSTPCGSTVIETAPALPLVADGLLVHTTAFSEPQSVQIALPPDFTCTNCTLQVSEFMSNHAINNPGGCFYHHCATITIVPRDGEGAGGAGGAGGGPDDGAAVSTSSSSGAGAGAGGTDDGGATTAGSGGGEADEGDSSLSSGCGCRAGAAGPATAAYMAILLSLGLLRWRRRAKLAARRDARAPEHTSRRSTTK